MDINRKVVTSGQIIAKEKYPMMSGSIESW